MNLLPDAIPALRVLLLAGAPPRPRAGARAEQRHLAHDRYSGDDFALISVHYPEFAREREIPNVQQAIDRWGIRSKIDRLAPESVIAMLRNP